MKIDSVDFFYLAMPVVTARPTAARMRWSCGSRPEAMSAGANARPRRCPRSPPSSARCRTAPAGRCRTPCWARRSTVRTTSPAWRRPSPITAWICCRRHTPGRASRWRCGTYWAGRAASRRGSCSATRSRSQGALCLGAVRHDAGRDPGARPEESGRRLRRRQVRLGADRQHHSKATSDQFDAAREGLGSDGILLIDVGPDVRRGRRRGGGTARRDGAQPRHLFEEPFYGSATRPMPRS